MVLDTSLKSPGLIATTWSWADQTFTVTKTSENVLNQDTTATSTVTVHYGWKPLTTAISTTPTPTSSTKPSAAEGKIRLSYGARALVGLAVIAIVL